MGVPNGQGQGQRILSCPAEAWLTDGRRVLHFKPVIWHRWQQELEVTSGEWLSHQLHRC